MLIEILILFFVTLLVSQLYLFIIDNSKTKEENVKIIEGYTDYEQTTYMLSQKNSLNIQDLKNRIDNMSKINNNYDELNNRLTIVEDKINGLVNDSITNTKGTNFDTSQTYDFSVNNEEDENKKDGLPTTIDMPPTDNLDTNNMNPPTDTSNINNMF
jgi:hypothetical protein